MKPAPQASVQITIPGEVSPGRLKSEAIVLSAPLSYSGSAKRIWRLTRTGAQGGKQVALVTTAVLLIAFAWFAVTAWYVVSLLIFGLVTIPYRLIRRGQRRDRLRQQQHRELVGELQRQRPGRDS